MFVMMVVVDLFFVFVHLKFVVEADNKGNLRVTKKPIWETASGKSIEKSIDYTKQQIRKRMGYYP